LTANNYGYFSSLQGMMKDIEKYAPASALVLQRRIRELQPQQDPSSRAWNEFSSLMSGANGANLDAALDYISHAPPQMRDSMYQQIAWHYLNKGETERAQQIVSEKISSPAERARLTAEFERQTAQRKAQEGKISDVRQFLSTLRSDDERATTLVQLAYNVSNKDKEAAMQLLDEAFNLIAGRPATLRA
jgi:thioredoxin-like negative regulator of GroEL